MRLKASLLAPLHSPWQRVCRQPIPNSPAVARTKLWQLAKAQENVHRFSTLFTAQQVRDYLGSETGITAAIDWCKKTAVTKVYIESFRDGFLASVRICSSPNSGFSPRGLTWSVASLRQVWANNPPDGM